MVGAERRQNTTQGAEGGKADQSDPAEGGGGGAVNRPAADPAVGRTPAKAVGRRRESGERTPAKAVGRSVGAEVARLQRRAVGATKRRTSERLQRRSIGRSFCKKVLPRSQRRRGLYITQVMGHFPQPKAEG